MSSTTPRRRTPGLRTPGLRTRLGAAQLGAACLLALAALAGPAQAATSPVPTSRSTETATDLDAFEGQVMVEINAARTAHGLAPVRLYDSCVEGMAERWGARIARYGNLIHREPATVLRKCRQSWAGETLIRGYRLTPEAVVAAWLDSPGHREVLLSPYARRAGISVNVDAGQRMIAVLNLARPSRR